MVNLELYKIFLVVAEEKNLTKASEKLNISQPAITKHIKNLENELGNPLFIRTKRGVILNEYGEKIFLKVKNAISLLNEAEKEIINSIDNNIGTIRIGISTSLVKNYLLKYLEEFNKLYPNIIITIYTDPTKDLIKNLKLGLIDIIICKEPSKLDNNLEFAPLGKTNYIFVANDKYKEFRNKKVNISDLIKYPLILQKRPSSARESIEKYLKENKCEIEPRMNIGSASLVLDFVSIGYGIGYVTELYASKYIKEEKLFEIDVDPIPESINFGILKINNNFLPSYINKFICFIKNDDIIR